VGTLFGALGAAVGAAVVAVMGRWDPAPNDIASFFFSGRACIPPWGPGNVVCAGDRVVVSALSSFLSRMAGDAGDAASGHADGGVTMGLRIDLTIATRSLLSARARTLFLGLALAAVTALMVLLQGLSTGIRENHAAHRDTISTAISTWAASSSPPPARPRRW